MFVAVLSKQERNMKDGYNWCYYLVGSADVLGQKEALKDLRAIPTSKKSKTGFIRAHEESVIAIETFRKGFSNYFDTYLDDSESSVKVPEDKRIKFEEMRKGQKIKYQFFSDSMITSTPLQTEKYHSNAINSVYAMLGAFGGMLLFSLSEKMPLRVGIEVGLATELKEGDIYGPVLMGAYKLESEVAEYPRVVIGSEFINYLQNLSNETEQFTGQDEEDKEICKRMANLCLGMICKDLDGVMILDYLGKGFLNNIRKIDSFEEIIRKAQEFAKQGYLQNREKMERKLALRYFLLQNYFRARLPI
jgi:hypothetical protein